MVNYIVSGCPRSGTSLLMQILSESGMPVATDNKRKADENNMHGYFEIEKLIDRLKETPELVFDYDDKVLKIIHYGLQFLPKGDYKIIYMERDIEEVLDSMEKMLGKEDPHREKTKDTFLRLNKKCLKLMEERQDIQYLIINFRNLINNPDEELEKIIKFYNINKEKKPVMKEVIDPSSYRNRR